MPTTDSHQKEGTMSKPIAILKVSDGVIRLLADDAKEELEAVGFTVIRIPAGCELSLLGVEELNV